MMATTDFLSFGTSGTAAVLSNAAYAGTTPANGFAAGILPKERLNKALRQSSAMVTALANLMVQQGIDALDDGNLTALRNNILQLLQVVSGAAVTQYDSNFIGANQQRTMPGFMSSFGGIKIQWTSVAFADVPIGTPGLTGSITFPVAFLNQCFLVLPVIEATAGNTTNLSIVITSKSLGGATFQVQEWSAASNPGTAVFLAIGW
jgi:hypothetical protein